MDSSNENMFLIVPNLTAAVEMSMRMARLEKKEAAFLLGLEPGHFARMLNPNDNSHFPPDLLDVAMDKFHNEFILEWQAWKRGKVIYTKSQLEVIQAIYRQLVIDNHPARFAVGQILGRQI